MSAISFVEGENENLARNLNHKKKLFKSYNLVNLPMSFNFSTVATPVMASQSNQCNVTINYFESSINKSFDGVQDNFKWINQNQWNLLKNILYLEPVCKQNIFFTSVLRQFLKYVLQYLLHSRVVNLFWFIRPILLKLVVRYLYKTNLGSIQ